MQENQALKFRHGAEFHIIFHEKQCDGPYRVCGVVLDSAAFQELRGSSAKMYLGFETNQIEFGPSSMARQGGEDERGSLSIQACAIISHALKFFYFKLWLCGFHGGVYEDLKRIDRCWIHGDVGTRNAVTR